MSDGSTTFRPFRKVFAMVPTNNFSKFRRRCNDEGISLDKALSSLVIIYSNGGEVVIPDAKKKVVLRECQYLRDREQAEENKKDWDEVTEPVNRRKTEETGEEASE